MITYRKREDAEDPESLTRMEDADCIFSPGGDG